MGTSSGALLAHLSRNAAMWKFVRWKRARRGGPPSALYNMVKAAPFEAAAVAAVGCTDTAGWRNQFGADCASMVADGHCKDGAFVADHEWAAGPDYSSPEKNCCACGKEIACVDTLGWHNQFAATCATYASEKHCVDGGFARGHEWAAGMEFGEPEKNCCECGKGSAADAPAAIPLAHPPSAVALNPPPPVRVMPPPPPPPVPMPAARTELN